MPSHRTTSTRPLTPRQLQMLAAIASFQASRQYCPTIGELAAELNISRSTAFEHIAELRAKDLLCASAGKARSLNLTSKALRLLERIRIDQTGPDRATGGYASIPLCGTVAAGAPIQAFETKDRLSLPSLFGEPGQLFALQVRGDSMIGDGIHDGDYVICRQARSAENGQLVVAMLDGESATLKRFYREPARARLEPANDSYQPIYSDDLQIQAVVIGLLRKF